MAKVTGEYSDAGTATIAKTYLKAKYKANKDVEFLPIVNNVFLPVSCPADLSDLIKTDLEGTGAISVK